MNEATGNPTMRDLAVYVEWGPGPVDCLKGEIIDPSYPFVVENMEIANLIPQNATTKIIKVLDNGKVLMVRPELTVAWVLGDRLDTRFRAWFDGLELHA